MARPLVPGNCSQCDAHCPDGLLNNLCRRCYDQRRNAVAAGAQLVLRRLNPYAGMARDHPKILDSLTEMEKRNEFLADHDVFTAADYLTVHDIVERAHDQVMKARRDERQLAHDQLDEMLKEYAVEIEEVVDQTQAYSDALEIEPEAGDDQTPKDTQSPEPLTPKPQDASPDITMKVEELKQKYRDIVKY